MTPWTAADLTALRRMVREDVPDKGIARRLGRTAKAVAAVRTRLGLRKHGRVRRRVLQLLREGNPPKVVAVMVGRSASCVRLIQSAARRWKAANPSAFLHRPRATATCEC